MRAITEALGWKYRTTWDNTPAVPFYATPSAPGTYGIRIRPISIEEWDIIPLERIPLLLNEKSWPGSNHAGFVFAIRPYLMKRMELGI